MTIKSLLSVLAFMCVVSISFGQFTIDAVKNYPFPTELVASATGTRIAWAADEQGKRNVYVAEGPDFKPRKRNELHERRRPGDHVVNDIEIDGKWVVFVRGGDHGSNWDDGLPVNPSFTTEQFKVQIISVPFAGGDVKTSFGRR